MLLVKARVKRLEIRSIVAVELTRRLIRANRARTRNSSRARAHALIVTRMMMAPAPSPALLLITPSLSAPYHPQGNYILFYFILFTVFLFFFPIANYDFF